MGNCITAIKKLLTRKREVVEDIIETLDEYDDIVFDKIEDILEDEIKKRTDMDIELGGYMDKIDDGLTTFARETLNGGYSKEKKE